jgi:hypothetical protein
MGDIEFWIFARFLDNDFSTLCYTNTCLDKSNCTLQREMFSLTDISFKICVIFIMTQILSCA